MQRQTKSHIIAFFVVLFLTIALALFSEFVPASFRETLDSALQGPFGKKFHLPDLEKIFSHSVYYFLWATLLLLFLAWRETDLRLLLAKLKFPLICGVALTTVVFLAVPCEFRVLADETNLLATSYSLYHQRILNNLLQVLPYYDTIHIVGQELATRPALYPFLISILHSLFGYHWQFGFVVNFFAGILLISTVVYLGRDLAGRVYGLAAGALVAAFPVFCITTTSTGFDAINTAFMMLVFVQMRHFLIKPSGREVETLILFTLLAGQCRYESILLALPVGIVILMRLHVLVNQPLSWRFPILPFLALPHLWQRILNKHVANAGDDNADAFGLKYIGENLAGLLRFFFKPFDNGHPTGWWILVLAVIGILIFLYRWVDGHDFSETSRELQKKRTTDSDLNLSHADNLKWLGLIVLGVGTSALVHLTYYFGNPEKPWISRITVMYVPLVAFWAAYALRHLMRRASVSWLYLVPALFLLVFYLPQANRNDSGKSLMLAREYKKIRHFFLDKPVDAQLIVAARPGMYVALGRGAVNFNHANADGKHLLKDFDRHLYTDIWVIQHIQYATGLSEEDEDLDEGYVLEPVLEFQNSAEEFIRISRLQSQKPLSQDD